MTLAGNRKFYTLLLLLLAITTLALFDKIEGQKALEAIMIIFATYVVGNVGEHVSTALRERK